MPGCLQRSERVEIAERAEHHQAALVALDRNVMRKAVGFPRARLSVSVKMVLCSPIRVATYLTLQDPRERRTHTPSREKPQNRNDDSQRQTSRRHENVKAKYVENHGPQNRQC